MFTAYWPPDACAKHLFLKLKRQTETTTSPALEATDNCLCKRHAVSVRLKELIRIPDISYFQEDMHCQQPHSRSRGCFYFDVNLFLWAVCDWGTNSALVSANIICLEPIFYSMNPDTTLYTLQLLERCFYFLLQYTTLLGSHCGLEAEAEIAFSFICFFSFLFSVGLQ